MKKLILSGLAILLCAPLWAQSAGQFGAGLVLGSPIGPTVKYWADDRLAFDAGLGLNVNTVLWGDALWHSWTLLPQPPQGKLGPYVGLGPRIETTSDTRFGLRTVGGLSYWTPRHPIELFLEAGPVFQLAADRGVDFDAGVGVRFYFGGLKAAAKK